MVGSVSVERGRRSAGPRTGPQALVRGYADSLPGRAQPGPFPRSGPRDLPAEPVPTRPGGLRAGLAGGGPWARGGNSRINLIAQ